VRRPASPLALALSLVALAAAPASAGPGAPAPTIQPGVSVGGVPVAGLTAEQAREVLREAIARPLGRRLVVAVGARRFSILPREAGVSVKLDLLVARALAAPPDRNVAVRPTLRASAARTLVDRVARAVYRAPVNSRVLYGLRRLRASRARPGRRLTRRAILEDRVAATLRSWTAPRFLRAHTVAVRPRITPRRLRAIVGPVVTVSRSERRARIFNRLRYVRTYRVAVGQPGHPTPRGLFRVQSKQVDPSWSVPRSGWAGALAGQVIPGGDWRNPIKARWIGFAGSVGFHGTHDLGSLGGAASHGCVRMTVDAVKDLYRRVRIGTPVYVR
jgi:hypothetical protein